MNSAIAALAAFVLLLLVVLAVRIVAGWVGAGKTGFIRVVVAVLIAGMLTWAAEQTLPFGSVLSLFVSRAAFRLMLGNTLFELVFPFGGVLSLFVSPLVFKLALGTTLLRAFAITVLTFAIVIGVVAALVGAAALTGLLGGYGE